MKTTHLLVAGLLAAFSASAGINIDTVLVGNAGNANDTTGFGGVTYEYFIGTYEVTNAQYASFLNATAATTDTHGLYNTSMNLSSHGGITRSGSSGNYAYSPKTGFENKPVNYVSFWDAARFSNWLTGGNTETGVYVLTSDGIDRNTITRDATAWAAGGVAIASESEWYKAAYYDGDGGYYKFPTQSNTVPNAVRPNGTDANSANFSSAVGTVTEVGSYSLAGSYYGTFDQGGNVWEWNDAIMYTSDRGLRGGSFPSSGDGLRSSYRGASFPPNEGSDVGFRVSSLAAIPEPSTYAAVFGCLALAIAIGRRKGRGTL